LYVLFFKVENNDFRDQIYFNFEWSWSLEFWNYLK
jgi:hypothetical protein